MSEINCIEEIPEGTFLINLKLIAKHQRTEPSLMAKYKDATYHKDYFCRWINIGIKLITWDYRIVIQSILQSYVLHWYHKYLVRPGMDITEAMISQHLYWPGVRYTVRKKVNDCDTWQRTKWSNIKYFKLPAN